MRKIILTIPFLLLFLHIMYAVDGPNQWTQSLITSFGVWQDGIVVNKTNQNTYL
jgi:hypothetical protein